jgi:hypothetical protein
MYILNHSLFGTDSILPGTEEICFTISFISLDLIQRDIKTQIAAVILYILKSQRSFVDISKSCHGIET